MSDKPEDWQAIALTLCAELHERLLKLHLWYYGFHYAVALNDHALYKSTLKEMREQANDRPEH